MAVKQARSRKAAGPAAPRRGAGQPASTPVDRWIVLIYMAATSPDLREIMEKDIAEMATRLRLLGPNELRIYALMDTPDGKYAIRHAIHQHAKGEPRDPQIMRVEAGREKALGRKGALLAQFIDWRFDRSAKDKSFASFPRTLLMLWGHSQGVAAALSQPGSPAYSMVGRGGFGLNEFSGDSLSLPQIRRSIAAGLGDKDTTTGEPAKIDVLSFDSCFMSAAEVSAEFQRVDPLAATRRKTGKKAQPPGEAPARVDYIVASQTAVLLDGLDYARLVDVFVESKPPGIVSSLTVGRRLVEQASATSQSPTSLSLLNTGKPGPYQAFRDAFEGLVRELAGILDTVTVTPTPNNPSVGLRRSQIAAAKGRHVPDPGVNRAEWLRIRGAFEQATWHRVRQFIDVGDLCRRLANSSRTRGLRLAAIEVLKSLQLPTANGEDQALVVDVRSLDPLLLSGVSLYCPWLFPTPEEVRAGAWNAVVDLFDYATQLWFNRGPDNWGAFLYHAQHVLEESRQRAVNTELADLRLAADEARRAHASWHGVADASASADAARPGRGKTGGGDGFTMAEPLEAFRAAGSAADHAASLNHLNRIHICPKPFPE